MGDADGELEKHLFIYLPFSKYWIQTKRIIYFPDHFSDRMQQNMFHVTDIWKYLEVKLSEVGIGKYIIVTTCFPLNIC